MDHSDMGHSPNHGSHMDHSAHGGGGDGDGGMHMMSPYLFTRTSDFFVLFKEANVQSTGGFVGALIASFFFALLATYVSEVMHIYEPRFAFSGNFGKRLAASVMHALRVLLHYVAMLIVMTMNVWLILAVVGGHALGFLVYSLTAAKVQKTVTPAEGSAHC